MRSCISCVPASLAMVLSVYDVKVSQSHLKTYLGTTQNGTRIDVTWHKIPFDRWGLQCEIKFGCVLEDLETDIANGIPSIAVILSAFLPHSVRDGLHAVVVTGIDEEYIYLNEPLTTDPTPVRLRKSVFIEAWEWYNNCAIRVKPIDCIRPNNLNGKK